MDTAAVLQIKAALALIERDLAALDRALAQLASSHRATVMAGEQGERILEGMRRTIPLRRLGQPEDVAGAVAYLVSDEAGYVTGQVLSVSGGLTMVG